MEAGREAPPALELDAKGVASGRGRSVVPRPTIVVGRVPATDDEALLLETLDGGIERPLLPFRAPFEICCTRWLIPRPCIAAMDRVSRTSRSNDPRRASLLCRDGTMSSGLSSVAGYSNISAAPVDVKRRSPAKGTSRREWRSLLPCRPHCCAGAGVPISRPGGAATIACVALMESCSLSV